MNLQPKGKVFSYIYKAAAVLLALSHFWPSICGTPALVMTTCGWLMMIGYTVFEFFRDRENKRPAKIRYLITGLITYSILLWSSVNFVLRNRMQ